MIFAFIVGVLVQAKDGLDSDELQGLGFLLSDLQDSLKTIRAGLEKES